MKTTIISMCTIACLLLVQQAEAQIKIRNATKATGAVTNAAKAATFSDEDAASLAKEAVDWMDEHNPVAEGDDPYAARLRKLTQGLESEDGLSLNFKVYKVIDVNAFACADGSIRIFSSLMDMMDDDELLGIIGHEIGHIKNKDTRDAIRQAYTRAAIGDAAAATSNEAATLSDTELGKLADEILGAKYSRKQEDEADKYAYEFLKRHGHDVMGLISTFNKFTEMAGDEERRKMSRMLSSHPDSKDRAAAIEKMAKADGLYKE
ncbi:M48 family metalloprotease [Parapedobacter tibetensis]|uniref:M48 family metalloprotease n=1 Tax=Parapedobacter tibetensis TaxID=2972951 RepID=UPI00214D9C1E|nr:M48 family metalloprotease [Parapedobacter tibetensis]